nr:MAG TPA: hypothetical protein [Caudoviricetes sp.]
MIFKLNESIPNISDKAIEEWQRASYDRRYQMTEQIIDKYNKQGLKNILPAIYDNFNYFGIDKNSNPYMKLLDELEFSPTEQQNDAFKLISKYQKSGKVDLSHDYLRWPSLYNRPLKDFEYTLNAFEIVMNRDEVSQFFNDITNIESSQFVDPETGDILPAGKPGDTGIDTIYGVIEQWTRDDEGRSNVPEEPTNFKYTLANALKHFKVPYTQYAKVCKNWVIQYFNMAVQSYNSKVNDVQYYADKVENILSLNKVKLTNSDKDKLLKEKNFATPKEVPNNLKKEGTIIYLREREHSPQGPNLDVEDVGYVVYHSGDWIPFDEYAVEVKQDRKTELLNMRTISVLNDKVQITAGILRAIDKITEEEEYQSDITNYL